MAAARKIAERQRGKGTGSRWLIFVANWTRDTRKLNCEGKCVANGEEDIISGFGFEQLDFPRRTDGIPRFNEI